MTTDRDKMIDTDEQADTSDIEIPETEARHRLRAYRVIGILFIGALVATAIVGWFALYTSPAVTAVVAILGVILYALLALILTSVILR